MGSTKDNVKVADKKDSAMFEGIKNLVGRKKDTKDNNPKTYVEQLIELQKRLAQMITEKAVDVKKDTGRYDYHRKVLTELEIQETLVQQIIESVARVADAADKDSGH